jgi:hypothetical protein
MNGVKAAEIMEMPFNGLMVGVVHQRIPPAHDSTM